MLRRPVRQVHVRFAPEEPEPKKAKKINKEESELVLLLQTEFNYLYRLYDGVWLSYREKESDGALLPPKQTPALIVRYVSPKDNPGVVDIDCVYLYNTAYLREHQMDYNHLIDDELIGVNVWVVSNKRVNVTGSYPSSAWKGVPVELQAGQVRMRNCVHRAVSWMPSLIPAECCGVARTDGDGRRRPRPQDRDGRGSDQ